MKKISKAEFVESVSDRHYTRPRLTRHVIGTVLAVVVSFAVVFVFPEIGMGMVVNSTIDGFQEYPFLSEVVQALSQVTILLFCFAFVYVFTSLPNGFALSATVVRSYRWLPLRFLVLTYFGVAIVAILISTFSVQFTTGHGIGSLSLLDSFYLVLSTLTTIGAGDIVPYSTTSKILLIVINVATLLLVVFIFQRIAHDVSFTADPKRFRREVGDYFDMINANLNQSDLSVKDKQTVLSFFKDKYYFDDGDELKMIFWMMRSGNFSHVGLKGKNKSSRNRK